jgi:DNA-binding MarR family transcriptional regulator
VLAFMQVLWAVDHRLRMKSKRMNQELGVTGLQRLVVRLLGRLPGLSAGKLAQTLHVHPSTLTGVLDRLEQRGIVRRTGDSNDGRRALFALTAKGRELDRQTAGTVEASVRRVLRSLSAQQIASARLVLESLADTLGED